MKCSECHGDNVEITIEKTWCHDCQQELSPLAVLMFNQTWEKAYADGGNGYWIGESSPRENMAEPFQEAWREGWQEESDGAKTSALHASEAQALKEQVQALEATVEEQAAHIGVLRTEHLDVYEWMGKTLTFLREMRESSDWARQMRIKIGKHLMTTEVVISKILSNRYL